jgi:hypothetical protein
MFPPLLNSLSLSTDEGEGDRYIIAAFDGYLKFMHSFDHHYRVFSDSYKIDIFMYFSTLYFKLLFIPESLAVRPGVIEYSLFLVLLFFSLMMF